MRTDKKKTAYERSFPLNYIDYILDWVNLGKDFLTGRDYPRSIEDDSAMLDPKIA